MKVPSLNYIQLINSRNYCLKKDKSDEFNEASINGFIGNVYRSFKEGLITEEQKNELLEIF